MNRLREDQLEGRRLFLLGRVVGPGPHRPGSLRGYVATAGSGGRVFDRTASDGTGRFLLEFDRGIVKALESVEVFVTSPWGARVGAQSTRVSDLDSPQVLLFRANHTQEIRAATRPSAPIQRFVANNESTIVVDSSCSDTVLEWTVRPDAQDVREMQVVLAENGQPVARDLPAQGSRSITSSRTAVYTMSVKSRSGSGFTIDAQTVTVKRLPTLAVYFDVTQFRANAPIPLGVVISCPAPDGGLRVRLVSSDSNKIIGGELVIPAGTKWGSTTLSGEAGTGDIELTGMASGYLRDTIHLEVVPDQSGQGGRTKWK